MVLSPSPREFNFLEWAWLGEILYSPAYPSNSIPRVTCSCPNCQLVSTDFWLGEGLGPHVDKDDGGWTLIATAYCDCLAALQNLQHNFFFFFLLRNGFDVRAKALWATIKHIARPQFESQLLSLVQLCYLRSRESSTRCNFRKHCK